jgi:hypothetical protein
MDLNALCPSLPYSIRPWPPPDPDDNWSTPDHSRPKSKSSADASKPSNGTWDSAIEKKY